MIKIITALNNPEINKELKKQNNIEIICKDIQYREGILEILEFNKKIDYIFLDENLPGEIFFEDLIENIIEKNENIKIIIFINKKNIKIKNNYEENKNIIKIYYENEINMNTLKNYNLENENKIINKNDFINKKIEKEKLKAKIITFLGDRKVGKSMTIINIAYYLQSKGFKIAIIELNEESPNINEIFKSKKIKEDRDFKTKRIKNNTIKTEKNFRKKFISQKVFEKFIIKINKNIDLISYNKLLNLKFINKFKFNYDYILLEIYSKKYKTKNKKIIMNSDENILLIKPNLLEIKKNKKIIEKYKINKLKILINYYNKYSIDEEIIKNIFNKNKIIGKIEYKEYYENLINTNFKKLIINEKVLKKEINDIINYI